MDKELRDRLFNETLRIAGELLRHAETDANGMSWKTMTIDYSKERSDPQYIVWRNAENIYAGNAGIALFFLELYKQSKDEKHREAAVEGMRWAVHACRETPSDYFSFFTGRMGVAYALLKLFDLTADDTYIGQALEIAEPCATFLNSETAVDDLINGTSGTLLGLLHLHAATGEEWLLEKVDLFLKHLIDRSHRGPRGLYWDFSAKQIRGLCGFSHGASGIGLAFMEAGRYLQNKALFRIAEDAFAYERYFFDESQKNWPDFRNGIWERQDYEDHKGAYLEGNASFFTTPKFMNAWCHGAAGIGLARLRAYEILPDDIFAAEARIVAAKTGETDIFPAGEADDRSKYRSYTLCHGGGGNAEIFLEAFKTFQDEQYLELAEKVARQALDVKQNGRPYISGFSFAGFREDTSLFMGNAGIGYFYLKVLKPSAVPSILLPRVPERKHRRKASGEILSTGSVGIRKRIIQKTFTRTAFLIDKIGAPKAVDYFVDHSSNGVSEEDQYIDFINDQLMPSLKDGEKDRIADVFALETEKYRIARGIISVSLLNIKTIVHSERVEELLQDPDAAGILQLELEIDPEVRLLSTGWDWHPEREATWLENLTAARDFHPVLLKADPGIMVVENHLSPFSYAVLASFQEKTAVRDAVREITANFESVTVEQEAAIRDSIIEQVRQVLMAGFLTDGAAGPESRQ